MQQAAAMVDISVLFGTGVVVALGWRPFGGGVST